MAARLRLRADLIPQLAVGGWGAAVALATGPAERFALGIPPVAALLSWWCFAQPERWVRLFFVCLLLTPPFPFPLGDSGIHIAPFVALPGVIVGLASLGKWRRLMPPVALAFAAFSALILMSAATTAFYSGAALAAGSLLRAGLFCLGVYVFFYSCVGPRDAASDPMRWFRFLFLLGIAVALFACVDYYYQLPAPAGFAPQFIWTDDGVFRRAQGLFYDASVLGNFCAFFLVMIAVALVRRPEEAPCGRRLLLAGGIVLTTALVFSWSRASLLNVLVACSVLIARRWRRIARFLVPAAIVAVCAAAAVQLLAPSIAAGYLSRIVRSVELFSYSPDGVLSGRLVHWQAILGFLWREPWHAIWGIGYKSLPYTSFFGAPVIADNTWLSLLAETGIIGVTVFLILNWCILTAAFRAARSPRTAAALGGEWMLCFWAGELAQMFSGDLITYWRVLPVFFWVLGIAVREAGEAL